MDETRLFRCASIINTLPLDNVMHVAEETTQLVYLDLPCTTAGDEVTVIGSTFRFFFRGEGACAGGPWGTLFAFGGMLSDFCTKGLRALI